VKIADFGIARCMKSTEDGTLFSQATTFVGTTRYMSPERLDGQPYEQQELSLLQLSTQPLQQ